MAKISLTLMVQGKKVCSGEGILDEQGKIVYTRKIGEIPQSHGLLNINDAYIQLLELWIILLVRLQYFRIIQIENSVQNVIYLTELSIIKKKYRNKYYEIKIDIEKDQNGAR